MLFRTDSLDILFQMSIKENLYKEAFSDKAFGLLYKTRISVINLWRTCHIFFQQRCLARSVCTFGYYFGLISVLQQRKLIQIPYNICAESQTPYYKKDV